MEVDFRRVTGDPVLPAGDIVEEFGWAAGMPTGGGGAALLGIIGASIIPCEEYKLETGAST